MPFKTVRSFRTWLYLSGTTLIGAACFGDSTDVRLPPRINNEIVFVVDSANNTNYDIWVMNPDGSDKRRLTSHPAIDHGPAVSPDGRHIAFVRLAQIFLMNADGSDQRQVTFDNTHKHAGLTWSPDGSRIVFAGQDVSSAEWHLFIHDLRSTATDTLTRSLLNPTRRIYHNPDWSPVADEIVFTKNDSLYWITPGGEVLRRGFYGDGHSNSRPRFSPDGTQIFFDIVQYDNDPGVIALIDSDGSNFRVFPTGVEPAGGAAWSPDGRHAAFAGNIAGDVEIFVIPVEGGTARNITNRLGVESQPTWR